MKTAAYTICKNEIKKVEQWLYYTKDFDYRVVLDTGSTDGTYEELQKVPGIILEQKRFEPFKFDQHRIYNLNMIPEDVDWCLSPDMDEYFSINVLDQMEKTIKQYPNVTNISCDRLDIYNDVVRVGPPNGLGTNKIHRRHLYTWYARVYEHLRYDGPGNEVEIYNDDIYLIHDQDITKPRSTLYYDLMCVEYAENPTNNWNNWFLANHYYREKDLENFVDVGICFIKYATTKDNKYKEIYNELNNIYSYSELDKSLKDRIRQVL
jgi:hypothetical protein